MTTTARPTPWAPPPEGFHYEAVRREGWITPADGGGGCRYGAGPRKPACGRPAVASLLRGYTRKSYWNYCEEHLYGSWIEDDEVLTWRLVKDDE